MSYSSNFNQPPPGFNPNQYQQSPPPPSVPTMPYNIAPPIPGGGPTSYTMPPPNFVSNQPPPISQSPSMFAPPPPPPAPPINFSAPPPPLYHHNQPPPHVIVAGQSPIDVTTPPPSSGQFDYYSTQQWHHTSQYNYNSHRQNTSNYSIPPPSLGGGGGGSTTYRRMLPPPPPPPSSSSALTSASSSTPRIIGSSSTNRNYNNESRSSSLTSSSSSSLYVPRSRRSCSTSSVGNSEFRDANNKTTSERDKLLTKWRSNYCEHFDDISRKLAELENDEEKEFWIRSSPADVYYQRTNNGKEVKSLPKLDSLCTLFSKELVERGENVRAAQKPYVKPPLRRKHKVCRHKSEKCSSSDSSGDEFDVDEEDSSMEELTRKILHPYRLHADLWHNETGEMNDGPLCRCSVKSRRSGIRHGIYPGETGFEKCDINSNNAEKLYHYRITISPPTNFLTKTPTIIKYDQHEFIFEGFSLLSHVPIGELPTCKVIRFNIEYTILYIEETMPENFTIRELDLFYQYLFVELLEMLDLNLKPGINENDSCASFHFLPRFVRDLPNNGKEVLAMSEVLRYLLDSAGPLVPRSTLEQMMNITQNDWQNYVYNIKEMIVTNPGMKPCSVRVDQLDRNVSDLPECIDQEEKGITNPVIVHFGIRPPQLSYAGNPDYQKAWREYVKFRHLVANMSKPSYDDKRKLENKENHLQEMRTQGRMKRNITVAISSKGFYRTGIMCDIVQHAMLIPVLTTHLRFHRALDVLESNIEYKFQNRYILQLALTHPSYKENFGTNPDHARNSLTNCGIRQPEYGDRKIHYQNTRKRGINTLINIMSRFGQEYETDSNITHNERLEFLGDAVVEFLTSIHLFFMFPELEEGGLATYRAAIVQNQHLAVLAKKLHLEEFMLYAHGSDLCHELELRHAMANCFEALMGALLLDGGITVADKVFAVALLEDNPELKDVWENIPPHPLQEQEPLGDRQWIEAYSMLKELTKFEDSIGVRFHHIRLLARAFTDRSIGFTHLTLGSNQRLEFLGDTVLQLICSEYLYRHFPEHHEGHLSLLRSSLVNNRTQAVVCDDLGMTQYAVYSNPKPDLKTKDRADLLEAFLGALYVDQGLDPCQTFCQVCLFPRLQVFIMNQDWNDPKSKLQQCCLTLRTMDGGEPDIPVYKVIECIGPTNTRVYTVAVYFRGKRLASATGHSIQQAEMNAAKAALENSRDLFPQLDHQKRVIAQSIKRQKRKDYSANGGGNNGDNQSHNGNGGDGSGVRSGNGGGDNGDSVMNGKSHNIGSNASGSNSSGGGMLHRKELLLEDESNLPKQYRMREDISSDELLSDSGKSVVVSESRSTKRKSKRKKKKKATGSGGGGGSSGGAGAGACGSVSDESNSTDNKRIKELSQTPEKPITKTTQDEDIPKMYQQTTLIIKDRTTRRILSCSSFSTDDDVDAFVSNSSLIDKPQNITKSQQQTIQSQSTSAINQILQMSSNYDKHSNNLLNDDAIEDLSSNDDLSIESGEII